MTNFQNLAIKYFNGEITTAEEKILYSWIKADEANRNQFHQWEQEWMESRKGVHSEDWEKMKGRLSAREVIDNGVIRSRKRSFPLWPVFAAAAMLLVAVLFFMPKPEPQYYAMEAPAGERCRMVLPDSSVVWLNSCSSLKIENSFNRKERNVILEGEGYFEVAHNPKKPFRVNCGDASVLVKGTKFNISAYHEDGLITTSVVEGHVEFSHGPAHVDLLKGQSARFDVLKRAFYMSKENPTDVSAWRDSRFIYENISLTELANKLSRTYAVTFHIANNSHMNDKFNISLRNNETLGDVLAALEKIIPVRTRIENDNVYIENI